MSEQDKKTSLLSEFIKSDIATIQHYFVYDRLIPGAKKVLMDIGCNILDGLKGGVGMLLYGSSNVPGTSSAGIAGKVDYSKMSTSPKPMIAKKNPADYDTIRFQDRASAENTLRAMKEAIVKYDFVPIADLFELAGVPVDGFTGNSYGWKDLSTATITVESDGFAIKMPMAVPRK